MELEMRPVADDELEAFVRSVEAAFGTIEPDDLIAAWAKATDPARTLAVFDAGEIVATSASAQMEVTLPGLVSVPMSGITAVGVWPTHRRQGLLNRMMERLLDDSAARGEAVAGLTASESVIYGRYGYGWATSFVEVEVLADHAEFARPARAEGRMRRVDKEAVLKLAPGLAERVRRRTNGDVSVPSEIWELVVDDHESRRSGWGPLFWAVHESASGQPDGLLGYRYKQDWPHGNPSSSVLAGEFWAETPEVEAALFRYLLDLDLVAKVKFGRPVQDHLRHRLADPRRYTVHSMGDHLWIRLVDVADALPLRRYTADGSVVLKVHDRFRPQNEGVYLLEGGPEGALCGHAPAGTDVDVELSVDALGAAFLGGVSFASLAMAGRCEERRPGGLRRADAMFLTDVEPWCRSGF